MTRLLDIALILCIILGCAHVYQMDKDFDHVARTCNLIAEFLEGRE